MVYEGEGFRLRPYRDGDVPDLVAVANDIAIARYMSIRFPFPYTRRDAETWITYTSEETRDLHRAIEVGGGVAGGISVETRSGERRHAAELGYWLAPAYWGRGIMTAATRAVLRHAFERLPIIRLESHVMLPNTGSARVLEKAGFVHEATLRDWYLARDGSLYDALVYRMLRSEIPAEDSHVRRSS